MKLSEAIMINGMSKPQGFGASSMYSVDAPCALGGALQSVNEQPEENKACGWIRLRKLWPWAEKQCNCPICGDFLEEIKETSEVFDVIWHLNDHHSWSRSQIAEWVATVEPKEGLETQDEIEASQRQESCLPCL